MRHSRHLITAFIAPLFFTPSLFGLEPNEILIIANSNFPASVRVAGYYCRKRGVPPKNILALPLGAGADDTISRVEYESRLAGPVRSKLSNHEFSGKIRCLLTTYGVPFKVAGRGPIKGQEENLKRLENLAGQQTSRLRDIMERLAVLGIEQDSSKPQVSLSRNVRDLYKNAEPQSKAALERIRSLADKARQRQEYERWLEYYGQLFGKGRQFRLAKNNQTLSLNVSAAETKSLREDRELIRRAADNNWSTAKRIEGGYYDSLANSGGLFKSIETLTADIGRLKGRQTSASVDSELSMVLFNDYELYKWQPNEFKNRIIWTGLKTLMVCRLDGPGEQIAKGLVEKAIAAEQKGLSGVAYIDSRGLEDKGGLYSHGYFDESLRDTAMIIRTRTKMPVVEERTEKLFEPGQCPRTAIYCGWYSVKNYVDAFDFVEGAVGYHIASWEAVNLRDPNSSQWCPAMLADGITATLGAVDEPYLHSFPDARTFFGGLLAGQCLVEAYYRAKPFNSWQLVLIGEPLYRPFRKPGQGG